VLDDRWTGFTTTDAGDPRDAAKLGAASGSREARSVQLLLTSLPLPGGRGTPLGSIWSFPEPPLWTRSASHFPRRIRQQVAALDRKIKAQIQALEKGIEPELVSERISELRGEKEALEEALSKIGAEREEAEVDELSKQLARVPDLGKALREAPPELQRQVFQAFELQILYDKGDRKIEISATVSEAVAGAFEKQKALPKEGSLVVVRDIAGAGFEPATFGL
jgi:hypothetical protein